MSLATSVHFDSPSHVTVEFENGETVMTVEEFEAWDNYAARHSRLVAENHSRTLAMFIANWRRGVKLLAREQTTKEKI